MELSSSAFAPVSLLAAALSSSCRKRCRASDIWLGCGATAVMLGHWVGYTQACSLGNFRNGKQGFLSVFVQPLRGMWTLFVRFLPPSLKSEAFDTEVRELASLCARLVPGRNHTPRAAVIDVSTSACRRHQLGLDLDRRTGMSDSCWCRPVPPTGAQVCKTLPDRWAD